MRQSQEQGPGDEWTLTARWVLPVTAPPLQGGTVTVRGDRIVAVEPHGRRAPDWDLGDCAVLPGFVNAHTHLDLGGLRGRTPPSADFTAWLRAVVRHRREQTPEQIEAAVRAGVRESVAAGTTLLGDISGLGMSWPVLAESPVRAVVFYELLGLPRDRAKRAWGAARAWLGDHPTTPTCRPGLSPHAPYSVRASLFRVAAAAARRHGLSLTAHLAETQAELQLLKSRRGPFVLFLEELGVWDPTGLVRSPAHALELCAAAPRALLAHGNYLDAPGPATTTVVYCPRTHAAFGHPPYPLAERLRSGTKVALGTDSLASNPDLSVLEEARFVCGRYPEIDAAEVLRLATLAGAEALGWEDQTGSLTPGKSADMAVVPLPLEDGRDPYCLVLTSGHPVRAVLWRGQWAHGGPGVSRAP